jgi:tetratricopeptide (TPR) repeat protein
VKAPALRLAVIGFAIAVATTSVRGALTHGAELAAIYDTILRARFDVAERRLAGACPTAPAEACRALETVRLWWQILMDPESRTLDPPFEAAATRAIRAAEAWTEREPDRAEAWFYLAGAYAPLVQWRVLRGQQLAAAREGSRIKNALERALALDPTLHDAHFGIGMYRYYADVVPAAVKVLRWLLLLPGGNREEGLKQMLEARQKGQLLQGETDFQLHYVYLWYERQPARAIELLTSLDGRYPSNPIFLKRIAEIQRDYLSDRPASAAAWNALLGRARLQQVAVPDIAEVNARLGLAEELDAMFETDRAIDELRLVLQMRPRRPHGADARAHLQLARAYDRIGERPLAVDEYNAAVQLAPEDEAGAAIRSRARDGLRTVPDAHAAHAYRLSLEGLRALERGAADSAAALLKRAVTMNPRDPVVRYRHASALRAAGNLRSALDELDRMAAVLPTLPPVVRAPAYFEYGAALEAFGDRVRAIDMYRVARDVIGGAPRARDEARSALGRLAP